MRRLVRTPIPMLVCVTGGTGFVGRALLPALAGRGHTVRRIVRPSPSSPHPARLQRESPAATIPAALGDPSALSAAFVGADAVIHLVGIISEAGPNTFEQVHLEGTRSVLAAARAANVPRFVHMSALGARPHAPSRYHQSKWSAEELVRSSGLAWTVFRPSIIYGPDDAFVNLFARIARISPILPLMGPGTSLLQPVGVGCVAEAFSAALEHPEAAFRTFDLVGNERLSMEALLRILLRVARRRRWLLRIPMPIARAQAAILELLCGGLLRRPPPLNRDQLQMLQEDNVGDGSAADQLFGLEHPPFEAGIARYVR